MATYSRDPVLEAATQDRRRNLVRPGFNYDSRNFYYTDQSPIGSEGIENLAGPERSKALAAFSGNPNFNQNQGQPVVNINLPGGSQGTPENPFKTISNTKSQPIAQQNVQQIDLFKSFNEGNKANLADYLKNFGAISKQSVNDFNQESRAVNDIYDPNGLRSRLNTNLDDYSRGMKGVADRALKASLRNLSARQMGAGASGASSYYSAQAQDAARGIDSQLLADMANRRSSLEQYMTGTGLQASGVRQRLGQNVLAGLTAPIDVRNRFLGQNIENLRGLSGIDLANTFYGLRDDSYQAPNFQFGGGGSGGGMNYGGDFYGGGYGGDGGDGGNNAMLNAIQKLLQPNRGVAPAYSMRTVSNPPLTYGSGGYAPGVSGGLDVAPQQLSELELLSGIDSGQFYGPQEAEPISYSLPYDIRNDIYEPYSATPPPSTQVPASFPNLYYGDYRNPDPLSIRRSF